MKKAKKKIDVYKEFLKSLSREKCEFEFTTVESQFEGGSLAVFIKKTKTLGRKKIKSISKVFEISTDDKRYVRVKRAQSKIKLKYKFSKFKPHRSLSLIFATYFLNEEFCAFNMKKNSIFEKIKFSDYSDRKYFEATANQKPLLSTISGVKMIEKYNLPALYYPYSRKKLKIRYPPSSIKSVDVFIQNKNPIKIETKSKKNNQYLNNRSLADRVVRPEINQTPTPPKRLVKHSELKVVFHNKDQETILTKDQSLFICKLSAAMIEHGRSSFTIPELSHFNILKTNWHNLFLSTNKNKYEIFIHLKGHVGIRPELIPLVNFNAV